MPLHTSPTPLPIGRLCCLLSVRLPYCAVEATVHIHTVHVPLLPISGSQVQKLLLMVVTLKQIRAMQTPM